MSRLRMKRSTAKSRTRFRPRAGSRCEEQDAPVTEAQQVDDRFGARPGRSPASWRRCGPGSLQASYLAKNDRRRADVIANGRPSLNTDNTWFDDPTAFCRVPRGEKRREINARAGIAGDASEHAEIDWRWMQPASNRSPRANSLLYGNLQGIFSICRELPFETHENARLIDALKPKFPAQRTGNFLSGIWEIW